jgi:hypothetical protein
MWPYKPVFRGDVPSLPSCNIMLVMAHHLWIQVCKATWWQWWYITSKYRFVRPHDGSDGTSPLNTGLWDHLMAVMAHHLSIQVCKATWWHITSKYRFVRPHDGSDGTSPLNTGLWDHLMAVMAHHLSEVMCHHCHHVALQTCIERWCTITAIMWSYKPVFRGDVPSLK